MRASALSGEHHQVRARLLNLRQQLDIVHRIARYRVQLAASLSAARAALQAELPQLLTLDRQLPDGSGLALLEQLRAEPATAALPVVVISGSLAQVPRVIALAQAVLAKPFALDELVSVVQRAGAPLSLSPCLAVGEPGGAYG